MENYGSLVHNSIFHGEQHRATRRLTRQNYAIVARLPVSKFLHVNEKHEGNFTFTLLLICCILLPNKMNVDYGTGINSNRLIPVQYIEKNIPGFFMPDHSIASWCVAMSTNVCGLIW